MDTIGAHVEIWKKIVDVQQHFNDLELRIRNFAIIVTGAFLGLGGNAIKDGGYANLFGHEISIAALIIFVSLFPLLAFYLMDRHWYHRLLKGAVNAGIEAEKQLESLSIKVKLGTNIMSASPLKLPILGWKISSCQKMDLAYGLIALAISVLGSILVFA